MRRILKGDKTGKTPRDALLNVRLSDEERRLFEQRSNKLGLSLSSWARMVLRREVGVNRGDNR